MFIDASTIVAIFAAALLFMGEDFDKTDIARAVPPAAAPPPAPPPAP